MDKIQSVIWTYIDTEKATLRAIQDYTQMKRMGTILSKEKLAATNFNLFRRQQLSEFLDWFEPAWYSISEEQRHILKEFYMTGNLKSGAGIRLQFMLNYSERQLHRIKRNAVAELSKMLFGK